MGGINIVSLELRQQNLGIHHVFRAAQRYDVHFSLPMTLGFQCVTSKMRRKFSKNTCLREAATEPQKVYLRTKNSRLRAFLFVACCLLLVSCFDKGDCLFTNTNLIKVSFKDSTATTKSKPLAVTSVYVPQQFIVYDAMSLSDFPLLADPNRNDITYVFKYETGADTLTLGYSTQTIVLSPDCGAFNYFGGLEVLYSTFGTDKVIIRNKRLLKSVPLNIDIFH